MDYSHYRIDDFVQDESFVQWVLSPTADLEAKWQGVLKNQPGKAGDMNVAKDLVSTLMDKATDEEAEIDSKKVWRNLQPVIRGEVQERTSRSLNGSTSHRTIPQWLKLAASIVLIGGLALWFSNATIEDLPAENHISTVVKSTPKGVKSRITLKDGSVVTLNAESTISYSSDYGDSLREISLTGEAFFEVAKNKNKPFIVKSGDVATTALGTSFNISSFPEDQEVVISLATGKVQVKELIDQPGQPREQHILDPGEQIQYTRGSQSFLKVKTRDDEAYLWKDGILSFKKASLKQITDKLERWYGVSIEVAELPTSVVNYDGIFNNQSLDNVLKAMGFSLNFDYTIQKKDIKIMFNQNSTI
ncbi:MAG: FecR domain-containing protein [Cyclobacteriaceae bacterium]